MGENLWNFFGGMVLIGVGIRAFMNVLLGTCPFENFFSIVFCILIYYVIDFILLSIIYYNIYHLLQFLLLLSLSSTWFLGWNFAFSAGTVMLTDCYLPVEATDVQAVNDFFLFSTAGLLSLASGLIFSDFGWFVLIYAVSAMMLLNVFFIFLAKSWKNVTNVRFSQQLFTSSITRTLYTGKVYLHYVVITYGYTTLGYWCLRWNWATYVSEYWLNGRGRFVP